LALSSGEDDVQKLSGYILAALEEEVATSNDNTGCGTE
jgi:hypothetical protein